MNWNNLKQFRCPKCGNDLCQSTLLERYHLYECCNGNTCGFSISKNKLIGIISNKNNKVKEEHYRPEDEVPENY
jgi:transcription initiation factor IIE alpha subunit